jgi:hypothetical protein
MKLDQSSSRHVSRLTHLNKIPHNILLHHDRDNIVEFVLHDLCHERGLNVEKAAYLMDNHDFNCLKGIAGFDKNYTFDDDIWVAPDRFSAHMEYSPFNQSVRSVNRASAQLKRQAHNPAFIKDIGDELKIKNLKYCSLPTKHDNISLFIYQMPEDVDVDEHYVLNGLSLLNLCPIF